jgi:hypothetical protein
MLRQNPGDKTATPNVIRLCLHAPGSRPYRPLARSISGKMRQPSHNLEWYAHRWCGWNAPLDLTVIFKVALAFLLLACGSAAAQDFACERRREALELVSRDRKDWPPLLQQWRDLILLVCPDRNMRGGAAPPEFSCERSREELKRRVSRNQKDWDPLLRQWRDVMRTLCPEKNMQGGAMAQGFSCERRREEAERLSRDREGQFARRFPG